MPKKVDHEQRRGQIAESVWQIAASSGLEAVSLSQVAAAAGISKGLVQHYFDSRDDLLAFASKTLRLRVEHRIRDRVSDQPTGPGAHLRDILLALLPSTPEDRREALAANAFFIRSLREPDLAEKFTEGQAELIAVLGHLIKAAQTTGELDPDLDPTLEADIALALAGGLGDAVLAHQHTTESATDVLDYHLRRLKAAP